MRHVFRLTMVAVALLAVALPAAAQDSNWSIGLGASGGQASPDGGDDIDLTAWTLFGRWQHAEKGWGAMAEIRDGEDDESGIDLEYNQLNLYATYTWLRDGMARPFVKFGASNTDIDQADDDTTFIVGGGVEVGRGRWAFHASLDMTEPEIGSIDVEFTHVTLGATLRF